MRGRYPEIVGQEVIRTHALGLAAVDAPLDVPVPTCPGWSLADLVWHLTEVQRFWEHVVTVRPAGPDGHEEPARPPDDELRAALEDAATSLVAALEGVDPGDPAWSWSDDDHTVGFTLRRQSHEALVHHVDGLLAAGADLPPIDPRLGADGVDEMIVVMLTGVPDWASFERRPGVVSLRARDTGDEWTLGLGRMTGTSPESGTSYDLGALELVDEPATTVVEGTALDLDLWLWGRRDLADLDVRGDDAAARQLRAIAAS